MKAVLLTFLLLGAAASSAFARQPIQYPTPVDSNPPTVTQCIAWGYLNQRCQECSIAIVNGTPQKFPSCQFTKTQSSCACTVNAKEAAGCTGATGQCTYY